MVLDVVYNHLGPEGNYLAAYGPYFTQRYHTPLGPALNFDGPDSDEVRRFFIDNALFWGSEYHIDALRLDALHAIVDLSPQPFVAELAATVHRARERWNRKFYLMAESDLNDVRLVRSPDLGGYGLDGHWNDDFHHALHTLLTGEQTGYYSDFGRLEQLAKAWREGFIYSGEYSPHRRRRHGSSSRDIAAERLVVFAQNHDQVGNRLGGERLSQLVSFEALKLAAGAVLLSPFLPLLFMGRSMAKLRRFGILSVTRIRHSLRPCGRGEKKSLRPSIGRANLPTPWMRQLFSGPSLTTVFARRESTEFSWNFTGNCSGSVRN